jgi:hypothetical protein
MSLFVKNELNIPLSLPIKNTSFSQMFLQEIPIFSKVCSSQHLCFALCRHECTPTESLELVVGFAQPNIPNICVLSMTNQQPRYTTCLMSKIIDELDTMFLVLQNQKNQMNICLHHFRHSQHFLF